MVNSVIADLEQSRCQIEGKFSRAGAVLESAVTSIGEQLEFLSRLNSLLDPASIRDAANELTTTASELKKLPALLDARVNQLRDLRRKGQALLTHVEEMRSLLKYLLVFALNVKITAADNEVDAQQFDIFAQEMRTRIENGEVEINDFEARANALLDQVSAALRLEANLGREADAMLPAVPNHLSDDAAAIGAHQKQIAEMTSQSSALVQQIQLKVVNALSALQIGDISRQRIEHVQKGLSLLVQAEADLIGDGRSDHALARFRQFVCRLLAAQMRDTAEGFKRDSQALVANMADIAKDAQDLLRLQQSQGASTSGNSRNLRSLEKSVEDAVTLVNDVEQAVASADQVRSAAVLAVDELAGRVDAIKRVREDVQFMALNTTVSCSRMGDAGKPLQVIAVELRIYAKKLDAIADVTLESLRALGQEVSKLDGTGTQSTSKMKLDDAATCLKTAADFAESSVAKIGAQCEGVFEALSKAENELNIESELGDVLVTAAATLQDFAGDGAIETWDIEVPLSSLLDELARSYTMASERDVHAQYSEMDRIAADAA
jgi:hypothetical protein